MSTRAEIVSAAKDLLWERGFESTSPKAILERSGAGQGSLYHHFEGKSDLAAAALGEVSQELIAGLDGIFGRTDRAPLENVVAYLKTSRQALKGCRMGRFAGESSIVANPALLAPIRVYFETVQSRIAKALTQAKKAGQFDAAASPADAAIAMMAVVQGGYVLARIFGDDAYMTRATNAAAKMLKSYAAVRRV